MSDRGLPTTEGAPACPFVAFEDDRDGRATAPDHRHRCFAETRPAPRALAHQEAYCLSSAFPVCPTFQDWARREAAAARPSPSGSETPRDEPPQSRAMPPLERDPYRPPADIPQAPPAHRAPQRGWAAPPPWSGEGTGAPAAGAAAAGAAAAGAGSYAADLYEDDRGDVARGAPDPYAPSRDDDQYAPPRDDDRYAPPPASRPAPPAQPAVPASRAPDAYPAESRGLAGSSAHRLAGPDPDEPMPARPTGGYPDDDLDDWAAGAAGAAVAGSAAASRATPPPARRSAPPRQTSGRDQVSKAPAPDPQELFGPAWERPRRYEAYPSLRTRMGLPSLGGLPRVAIWALILMLVALFLFLFGPGLLGFGDDDQGIGGASPTPAVTEEPTDEPVPTEPPAPTQQVYIVVKGDTMSRIAKKHGLTLDELMAGNPKIKNPNSIDIGDEIIIPVPVEDDTGEETPAP